MTRWRVTATMRGRRIATALYWLKRFHAQRYADETNQHHPGAHARVVLDSEEVRRMIP